MSCVKWTSQQVSIEYSTQTLETNHSSQQPIEVYLKQTPSWDTSKSYQIQKGCILSGHYAVKLKINSKH
ncbi:mCG147655 [Mus musculus]|nr:mCG147655 [Mus musculus]